MSEAGWVGRTMSADAELRARLELNLHLHNLTQAEKTLLARDLLQFATPEEALRVAAELLIRLCVEDTIRGVTGSDIGEAALFAERALRDIDDESKAREAGGT